MQKILKKVICTAGTMAIFTYGGALSSALSVEAAVKCGPKPAAPSHWQIPANNKTVHWGYFSKGLRHRQLSIPEITSFPDDGEGIKRG